jgi:purine-binding chemotaxis protein CheW
MSATVNETEGAKTRGGKFLTFFLADEEYGIEILKVQEIIGLLPITHIPRSPVFIKGVVNLRGRIIPVVDLRLKLSMEEAGHTERTCIIVVKTSTLHIGVIVDKVCEVVNIAGDNIDDTPVLGQAVDNEYILGIGKVGERVKLLLDIDKVLSADDLQHFQAIGAAFGAGGGAHPSAGSAATGGKHV